MREPRLSEVKLAEEDWDVVLSWTERLGNKPHAEALEALETTGLSEAVLAAVRLNLELGEPPPDPVHHRSGDRIGARIELRSHLRDGGEGSVYLGLYEREGATVPVAVKLARAPRDAALYAELRERWEQEKRFLQELSLSGCVPPLIEAGEYIQPDGSPMLYLCTAYKYGLDLREWCAAHELAPRARVGLFLAVCDAVATIHSHGLVHADLKPENVQVQDRDGVPAVWILDLGLTAIQGRRWYSADQLVGTPRYMSPEQISGVYGPISEATDVYALGAVLFELLENRPFFDVRSVLDAQDLLEQRSRVAKLRLTSALPGIERKELENVLRRATSMQPQDRFVRISAFRDAVRQAAFLERSEPASGRGGVSPPLFGAPRGRSRAFVGRDAEIEQLRTLLDRGAQVSIAAAIEGLAGIGKTELALQVVSDLGERGRFPGGIFWLDAEVPDLRTAWGGRIADHCGVPEGTVEKRSATLLREIEGKREPVLLVLDNVASWAAAQRPGPLPSGAHVHLLVTTRTRNLGGAQFEHVELGRLESPHARELILSLAGRQPDPGLEELLAHIDGYTLALELAGAFLRTYSAETGASYLALLRRDADQAEAAVADRIRYERTVNQAFQTLWDRVSPAVRDAWHLAACFEPEPATRELAADVGLDAGALRALESLHLIRSTSRGHWLMHRLTRAFGRITGAPDELASASRRFAEGCVARARQIHTSISVYLEDRPHIDAAVRMAPQTLAPLLELRLLRGVGPALMVQQTYVTPEIARLLERAGELAERTGRPEEKLVNLQLLWLHYMFRAEWKRCIEIAGRIALMASEFGSPRYRTCERVLSGVTAYYAGRFSEARILLDESMSVLQTGDAAMRRTIPLGSLEAWVGLVRCITGHPEQGLALERRTERQLTLSEGASPMSLEAWRAKLHQSSDPGATFTTLGWWHGKLHQFRDEKNAVAYLARKAAPEIANAHSLLIFQTYNTIFLVWARASRDVNSEERVRMLETLQSALRNAERMELRLGRAYLLGLSADACARLGERAAALGYLAEAFEWLERTDERFFEAELLRIRASLTPALHEKLALLDAAVAVALQQGAVWWALRAATERVTVRRDGPSVAQLAELYFGFSEGFGLPDLRRARAALASIL